MQDSTTSTAGRIRALIAQQFNVPPDDPDFNEDVHLFDYGYVDSFGAVQLIASIEKEFGITIAQSDLIAYPMNTINQIAGFVTKRQKGEI